MGLCYGMASLTEIFRLFQTLSQNWREMFESFDYNQDGIIDAAELASALNYYECVLFHVRWLRSMTIRHNRLQVGPPVINFLVHKYGVLQSSYLRAVVTQTRPTGTHATDNHSGPPQIELDRFVCACVVVQQMCALYDRCEVGRAGAMEVSRDDFLLAILRLP